MQGGQQRLVRGSTVSKLLLLLSTGCATNPRTTWLAGSVFNLSEHEARWPEHYRTGSTRTLSAPASPTGFSPEASRKLGQNSACRRVGTPCPCKNPSESACIRGFGAARRGSNGLAALS